MAEALQARHDHEADIQDLQNDHQYFFGDWQEVALQSGSTMRRR